ncbi:cold shock domain-containing protein [Nocardia tengchongensis]|uniref:cold shock domain-containing protein n=1 Tax=Nocardia tengchongensis TaxID=2055889 RepID=UPI00365E846C
MAWFDTRKGFGFLTPDTGAAVFVDYRVIEVPGFKTLTAGQPVLYTATTTSRGPEATRVGPATAPTDDHTRRDRRIVHRPHLPCRRLRRHTS